MRQLVVVLCVIALLIGAAVGCWGWIVAARELDDLVREANDLQRGPARPAFDAPPEAAGDVIKCLDDHSSLQGFGRLVVAFRGSIDGALLEDTQAARDWFEEALRCADHAQVYPSASAPRFFRWNEAGGETYLTHRNGLERVIEAQLRLRTVSRRDGERESLAACNDALRLMVDVSIASGSQRGPEFVPRGGIVESCLRGIETADASMVARFLNTTVRARQRLAQLDDGDSLAAIELQLCRYADLLAGRADLAPMNSYRVNGCTSGLDLIDRVGLRLSFPETRRRLRTAETRTAELARLGLEPRSPRVDTQLQLLEFAARWRLGERVETLESDEVSAVASSSSFRVRAFSRSLRIRGATLDTAPADAVHAIELQRAPH